MALSARAQNNIQPRPTLGRRLDIASRHAMPVFGTLIIMLLTQAPFRLASQAALLPAVTVIAVWFWSLARPASMPPPAVFMLGVLLDLMGYLPLGVGVLILLAVQGAALRLARPLAPRGFLLGWFVFVWIATGAAMLTWVLVSLLTFRLIAAGPAMFQTVLTVALFPALSIPLGAAHRTIAAPEQA